MGARLLPLSLALVVAAPAVALAEEEGRVRLRLDVSQAEAALAVVARHAAGEPVRDEDWARLFGSEPYRRLARREAALGRSFTEEAFRAFALSPELAARAAALERTLGDWRAADLEAAAARALAYLPPAARLRATVYPVVKPRSNSFVFETTTDPAIFLYLDPAKSAAEVENTVAHELHHVGLASLAAAYEERIAVLPSNARKAAEWLGALGEGVAVLAAAGSLDVHPLAAFPEADRIRWNQDFAAVSDQLVQLDRFLLDVVEGGFARPEVADRVAFTFFGYRGPWYTVGYQIAATVERRLGRAALVDALADPRRLIARYDEAAAAANAEGAALARFSPALLAALETP